MNKYEVLHLGKVPDKETTACSVCKDTRPVEREIIRLANKCTRVTVVTVPVLVSRVGQF
jgi:hypothetical protein